MVSDGEHSCTDKRKEKQQNNRFSALQCPYMRVYDRRRQGILTISHQLSHCLAFLKSFVASKKKRNKKDPFPHDIVTFWFQKVGLLPTSKRHTVKLAFSS